MRILGTVLAFMLVASPAAAWTPHHPVGYVKRVAGTVTVERAGIDKPVRVGDAIYEGDAYETGSGSGMGCTLIDGTRLTTGENSTFSIDRYQFDNEEERFEFVTRLWEGTYEFVSGLMNKVSPGATQIVTPTGTIRPDGTRFVIRVAGDSPPVRRRVRRG